MSISYFFGGKGSFPSNICTIETKPSCRAVTTTLLCAHNSPKITEFLIRVERIRHIKYSIEKLIYFSNLLQPGIFLCQRNTYLPAIGSATLNFPFRVYKLWNIFLQTVTQCSIFNSN